MESKRLTQLIYMFSDITGLSPDESREIILLTDTGKAVAAGNMAVMYEQETANLYSIGIELRNIGCHAELANLFSTTAIVASMNKLSAKESKMDSVASTTFTAPSMAALKAKEKTRILSEQSRKLQIKRQNQKNAWRIKNADNFEG